MLRAADLEAQQSYLLAARRRHNIGQHGWGIVYGLEIRDTPELVVQPGVAVDGYGRELIVTSPVDISRRVFVELQDDVLDVWLIYQSSAANVPQRGSWSCGPETNTRSREQAILRLTPGVASGPRLPPEVPREPFEVPSADLPFPPHRTPPDDPAMEWPVYLGTIKVKGAPASDPLPPRPFATLNGEQVTAPSGLASMQVGAELKSDTKRFAVRLTDASGQSVERLGIDRGGNISLNGNTTVTDSPSTPNPGELHLRLGPARLLNFRPLAATPTAAAPWRIYRTSVKEGNQTIRQLRFEIAHPGDKGEPAASRLMIGTRDNKIAEPNEPPVFSPCLTVSADCTVTINGNVNVTGQLVDGPVRADASDPRFADLILENWAIGTTIGEVRSTTGTIVGTVTDNNGRALPNVTVVIEDGASYTKIVETNALGLFAAPLVPVGTYGISAQARRFQSTTVSATVEAAETVNVPITLLPTATINAHVTSIGTDMVGIKVVVTSTTTHFTANKLTVAGGIASFTVPIDTYTISADSPPNPTETRTLTAGQTITVDLEIQTAIPTPP